MFQLRLLPWRSPSWRAAAKLRPSGRQVIATATRITRAVPSSTWNSGFADPHHAYDPHGHIVHSHVSTHLPRRMAELEQALHHLMNDVGVRPAVQGAGVAGGSAPPAPYPAPTPYQAAYPPAPAYQPDNAPAALPPR
ncbi:MAG: hypothetical protein HY000_04075 [Planctomycetes bacterium]|nr:hypothetical protein [Planctomycetota bacterium]